MAKKPLFLAWALLGLFLSGAVFAQDWSSDDAVAKMRRAAGKLKAESTEGAAKAVEPLAAERTMFDAACGPDVDLETSGAVGSAIPRGNQSWVGNCWAYAGCFGLEYTQRRKAASSPGAEVYSCDPVMTSVAVKLGYAEGLPDHFDKDGRRAGTFVDSDSFVNFPEKLKASRFGRAGQGDLCKARGCYCARVTDKDVSGPELLSQYYAARDIVNGHLRKVWQRKHSFGLALPEEAGDADYDDAGKTVLRIARELDGAMLSGVIRSSLDDGTLAHLLTMQTLGAAFDNKLAARTILQQSCMPQPVPEGFKVVKGPAALGDDERRKIASDPLSSEEKMRGMYKWLSSELDGSTPVMIGFCSGLLGYQDPHDPKNGNYVEPAPEAAGAAMSTSPTGAPGCGQHAVVVVGRRKIGGACYLGVRNSWGDGKLKNPELRYNSPPDGTVWVPASLLLQNTFDLGVFQ